LSGKLAVSFGGRLRASTRHVRAAFNPQFAQLQNQFNRAHNSLW